MKSRAVLPLAAGLGAVEREVLALALELERPLVILDDALARRFAQRLRLPVTGTLGLLLKAKQNRTIERIAPYLARLEALGFRLDASTLRTSWSWPASLREREDAAEKFAALDFN